MNFLSEDAFYSLPNIKRFDLSKIEAHADSKKNMEHPFFPPPPPPHTHTQKKNGIRILEYMLHKTLWEKEKMLVISIFSLSQFICPCIERSGSILFYRCLSVRPFVCLHKLNMKT